MSDAFETEATIFIDQSTTGIYGTNIDTLIEKRLKLTIGNSSDQIHVEFSYLGKGLLGNDVLEHFEVVVDNDENLIHLSSRDSIETETGHAIIPGILNDSLWIVNRIESSLSQKLSIGDTIININRQVPSDLYDSYCDYFLGIGRILNEDVMELVTTESDTLIIAL